MKKEFIPTGFLAISNNGGVAIMIINESYEDKVIYQWFNEKPSRPCKIYYDAKGDAYFKICNRRYYLNEFSRY